MGIGANILWDILVTFTRVGMFGFGGGPSMIPLLQEEVVEVRGWIDASEFADLLAMGNVLPGPITTKLAAVIGQRLAGPPGVIAGLVGLTVPTAVLMTGLAAFAMEFSDNPRVIGALKAARPAVVAMLAWTAWIVGSAASQGLESRGLLWFGGIAIAAFALLTWGDLHPALVIVMAAIIGSIFLA